MRVKSDLENMRIYPTISIVIATYNSERTLRLCLQKVQEQVYEKNKLEIIIIDGGSKDSTLRIAKEYRAKIIPVDSKKQNAEYNKGVGVSVARNEIVLLLDHDNIMPHKKWLLAMMKPFTENDQVVATEPLRFHYDSTMTMLDRYFSLIGGSDPVVYYFNKNSHLSWAFDGYNLYGKAVNKKDYYLVTYSPDKIPALGGNGAAIRRKILLQHAHADPENFIHTDVIAELIQNGYATFGIVKDTIIHLTNNEIIPFLSRRQYFLVKYQFEDSAKRRYYIYDPKKDKLKLFMYIIVSLTFIIPTWDAIKGFYKVRDVAWFLHPIMCFAFLVSYSIPIFKGRINHVILGK